MVRNTRPNPYINLEQQDWWHPEEVSLEDASLSEEQISRFRQDGFIVVTGLWPADLIDRTAVTASTRSARRSREGLIKSIVA